MMIMLVLINLLAVAGAQNNPYSCTANGNYTSNSTYSADLNALLSSLPSNMSNYGFYSSSVGTANALALCRADRGLDECRQCVGAATGELLVSCRNRRQGAMWYEYCMVRYSDHPMHETSVTDATVILRNTQNVSEGNQFYREDVTRLLADLRVEAANGSSALKAGAGTRSTAEKESSTIYALLQCTPDLSSEDCRRCLADMANDMLGVVDISEGVRILGPNCITRYELYSFYNDTRLMELGVLRLHLHHHQHEKETTTPRKLLR